MHPTSNRGIVYWFPRNLAGTAMGIKQMGVTCGSALAAVVLIPIANLTNWRFALGISTVLLLVMGILSYCFYRDPIINDIDRKLNDHSEFLKIFKSFFWHKPLVVVSVAAMGLTSAQLSLTTYLIFYFSENLMYPAIVAGSFLSLFEVGGSLGRLAWGTVSDRLFKGKRLPILVIISMITAICSLVFFLFGARC
jgi:sugar phosphate permease